MQAVDYGLVQHRDGTFLAPHSSAKEQIFWQCVQSSVPRKVTLSLEPIISIAGLMRLHRDFRTSAITIRQLVRRAIPVPWFVFNPERVVLWER